MKKSIITALALAGLLAAPIIIMADDQSSQQGQQQQSQIGSQIQRTGEAISQAAGTEAQQPPTELNKASKLIGTKVVNQSDEKLGTVKDVIIENKSQRVSYLWVKKTKEEGNTGKYVAIPCNVFAPSSDQKNLVLNTDKQKFESAQGYEDTQMPSLAQVQNQSSFWQSISEPSGAQPQSKEKK